MTRNAKEQFHTSGLNCKIFVIKTTKWMMLQIFWMTYLTKEAAIEQQSRASCCPCCLVSLLNLNCGESQVLLLFYRPPPTAQDPPQPPPTKYQTLFTMPLCKYFKMPEGICSARSTCCTQVEVILWRWPLIRPIIASSVLLFVWILIKICWTKYLKKELLTSTCILNLNLDIVFILQSF